MATREENLKKINEQLEEIAGGIFVPPAIQKQFYPPKMQSNYFGPFKETPN